MPNARGDRAMLLMRRQAVFGTPEAAVDGDYYCLPFYSFNVVPSEDASPDDAIKGDAFPADSDRGLQNLGGQLEVPMGLSSIGWHLHGMLGAPATTGVSPNFTHVFEAGADPVHAAHTVGITHKQINEHFRQFGNTYTDMSLSARKDGARARVQFSMGGRREESQAATQDATPVLFSNEDVPVGFRAMLKRDGVADASITSIDLRLASGVTPDQEAMNGNAFAEEMNPGRWDLTGQLTARYRDDTWYDLGENGAALTLEIEYILNLQRSIVFRAHNLRVERSGVPISGGDVITSTFAFRANRPADGDTPLRVTLKNAVANYDNL